MSAPAWLEDLKDEARGAGLLMPSGELGVLIRQRDLLSLLALFEQTGATLERTARLCSCPNCELAREVIVAYKRGPTP